MTTQILFADTDAEWAAWAPHLRQALADAGVEADFHRDPTRHLDTDFIVYAPRSPLQDFSPFTRLKAILSMWAGVERIVGNPTITVPLARMVDPGLTQGMVEYCMGHILRYHLQLDAHICRSDTLWQPELLPPVAADRSVCVLGLGALGQAVCEAALTMGFRLSGWSRTPKSLPGVTTFSGRDGLYQALAGAEILVVLLPLTPQTRDLLDAETLARLPRGARLINPGRGPLIVDDALIAALDCGALGHATLDVFRREPLPAEHPFWAHPGVTVTPHIAADTRPQTAASVIAENIRRALAGEPLLHLVDRTAGY